MSVDPEVMQIDLQLFSLLPLCYRSLYSKIAYSREDSEALFRHNSKFQSREFSVSPPQKFITRPFKTEVLR